MTIPLAAPSDDIHALVFRFLGAFAHIQVVIDDMLAKRFFESRIPETSKFVLESSIARIRDSDRPGLVTLIAADTESDIELSCFIDVYKGAKQLRDKCAHSVRIVATTADEIELTSSILSYGTKNSRQPAKVTRAELAEALKSCAWIEAQIMYLLASSDLIKALSVGTQPVTVAKPSRLPKDWDGVVLVPSSE